MTSSTGEITAKFIEYLHENYEVDCGKLIRKKAYKQWKKGSEVGTVGARGYKTLSVMGKRYYVHRLIFLMEYGFLPDLIDHINGDKTDNRIENLREAGKVENALNLLGPHTDNVSGFLGVTYRKDTGKYSARFRGITLGCFDSPEEAHLAYSEYKEEVC